VTLTGKGKFTGSKTISFKIVPKKMSAPKVAVGKKQMTVSWAKLSSAQNVTKYQVRYRVSGDSWTTTSINTSKSSVTIKKLEAGKNYQVQVRAYKKVGSIIYNGAWSSTRNSAAIAS